MKNCAAIIIATVLFNAIILEASDTPDANTIYDSDTNHLWNRLNKTLFERTAQDGKKYGLDELDILYWNRTTNLLAGVSHQQAISVLDEFINSHGEKLIRDPLKRALLQRDLWELFDWSAVWRYLYGTRYIQGREELQKRLAIVIHRLALTTNEIASLPDNYVQAVKSNLSDLPHGLFETNGNWVNLDPDPYGRLEIAPTHDHSVGELSAFLVMLHLPEGRQAALSYLEELRSFTQFERLWIYQTNQFATTNSPQEILTLNTNLPEFPTNTEWALVRRMLVIDTDGNIQPTPVVESIQLRRYLAIAKPTMLFVTNLNGGVSYQSFPPQKFYEFQMNRRENGMLREVTKDEKDFLFVHFRGLGIDPFEDVQYAQEDFRSGVIESCRSCHTAIGIYSVNSYNSGSFQPRLLDHPELYNSDANDVTRAAIGWKLGRFEWGLLQGLWNQEN